MIMFLGEFLHCIDIKKSGENCTKGFLGKFFAKVSIFGGKTVTSHQI